MGMFKYVQVSLRLYYYMAASKRQKLEINDPKQARKRPNLSPISCYPNYSSSYFLFYPLLIPPDPSCIVTVERLVICVHMFPLARRYIQLGRLFTMLFLLLLLNERRNRKNIQFLPSIHLLLICIQDEQ